MSDEQPLQPDETTTPSEPTAAAVGQETTRASWRTRRWLVGGMLVAVGLAAGGGTTYAFTSTNNDGIGNGTSVIAGAAAGAPSGRPTGAPRGASDPDSQPA